MVAEALHLLDDAIVQHDLYWCEPGTEVIDQRMYRTYRAHNAAYRDFCSRGGLPEPDRNPADRETNEPGADDAHDDMDRLIADAKHGDAAACYRLWSLTENAIGTVRSLRAGRIWLTRAALLGSSRARFQLGYALAMEGERSPADRKRAAYWLALVRHTHPIANYYISELRDSA